VLVLSLDKFVSLKQMTLMKLLFRLRFLPVILIGVLFLSSCEKNKNSGLPTDGDGNEYDTVAIGTQVWLAENLKTTKYNNGVSIPLVTDNTQWASMTSAAFCWYSNNQDYKEDYGALYNSYAVNSNILCPVGWHVPTQEEWKSLINYVGDLAGAKLKDRNLNFWKDYVDCKTLDFGFNARAGGGRSTIDGQTGGLREEGEWWSSTKSLYSNGYFWKIAIRDDFCEIFEGTTNPTAGISIRCIKNK
jgi:uncharacterized protein (TIGR02145 family)